MSTRHIKHDEEPEPQNPFPYGSVAWSNWESENDRRLLHIRTIRLLEGDLAPQTQQDVDYLRDMGGVRGARAGWPKKWTVCKRCHAEWQATGFPAPKLSSVNFALTKCRFGAWLFPSVCESCDDQLRAVKAPPAKLSTVKKTKQPFKDNE
jgi:hypothetical protein